MQKYKFTATFEDGSEKTTEVDQRDIRRWEAETERSWITDDMTVTAATMLAFYGLSRTGQFTGTWEEFDRTCVWVKEVSSERANPTRKARTAG